MIPPRVQSHHLDRAKIDQSHEPGGDHNPPMEAFYNHPEFSDLTLILRDLAGQTQSIQVHRVILAAKSEFFKTMLTSNFREGHQLQVTVEVPTLETATNLLTWMYSSETTIPLELTELADMWLVTGRRMHRPMEYPGVKSNFFQNGVIYGLNGTLQSINYYTFNLKSPIQSFSLWVEPKPRVQLTVYLVGCGQILHSSQDDITNQVMQLRRDFLEYLKSNDIEIIPESLALTNGQFQVTAPDQVYHLLELIILNNGFNEEANRNLTKFLHSIKDQ
jgi:hypothetical protein